jgi:YesN/AraC family two-component response regulator
MIGNGMTGTAGFQPGGRVLVVEDEFLIRHCLCEQLCEHGFEVLAVANGDEAIEVLNQEDVSFVITDVRMPGSIDGLRLAYMLCEDWPEIEVVVVSGHVAQKNLPPDVPLVRKPYSIAELVGTMSRLAARRGERLGSH